MVLKLLFQLCCFPGQLSNLVAGQLKQFDITHTVVFRFRVFFAGFTAARSALILSNNAPARFSPLISSGLSLRHCSVSSPRKALARMDWVRLFTRDRALLTCCSMRSAWAKGWSTRRTISVCSSMGGQLKGYAASFFALMFDWLTPSDLTALQ